ncbi:304_t:CDS:2 [Funneliformis mosseae]|uniref:304_t:CDS:1 n=1 Tax=Funneliformis mosseae TaxID=27381 RepID=A0A9N8VJ35_FUNMO|nr:304_t:CDS:2 [Funneliformis mosseae]
MKPHLKLVQGSLEEQELQDDNSKTRLEIATLLTQQKHPPEATSFCKNVDLEEQLKTKEDIFDKKSQFEALDVLCVSRSQKAKVETTASPPKDITMNVDGPSDVSENILDNTSVAFAMLIC